MYRFMSSANSDILTTSFPICIPFIYLFLWLPCLGLPNLCWIVVVRVEFLVLFLILEKMLPVFHHWEWCWLWVCHIWLLLCWNMFPLCPISGEFLSYMGVEFCQKIFCLYWDDHIVFILQFVNMVFYIVWFAFIGDSFHPWDKSHLIIVYDPFNVLLDSVCYYFVEDFCICIHQWYWSIISFFCNIFVWFWYQGDFYIVESVWICSFLCKFLEELRKNAMDSSLNV